MARPPAIERDTAAIATLDIRNIGLTDDQFLLLCHDNEALRFEINAQGELIIMSGGNPETGYKNAEIVGQLRN